MEIYKKLVFLIALLWNCANSNQQPVEDAQSCLCLPGVVDYERIDRMIADKIASAETHPGLVYDGCKTSTSGGCFWTAIIAPSYTNFTRANETCASYGSVLAVIPDRKTYDEITMNMRKKLTAEWYVISCWLGMTYNVTTGEIHPPGAYNNEKLSVELRSYNPSDTNLLVNIKLKRNPNREGLFNRNKSMKYGGAVCWKPKI